MSVGLALAGGALLGGIAGSQGQQAIQRRTIGSESGLSRFVRGNIFKSGLQDLQSFADQFTLQDVATGRQAQIDLAAQLQALSESGGLPSAEDFAQGRGTAQNLLAGERASLANSLARAQEQSNRQAARLGRSTNDPILQAQLRRQGIEAERELAGRETALTQQIGSSLPLQRLQFAQQRAGLLQGIGAQASTLRSNLLGVGTNIQNLENQIRLGSGTTTINQGGGLQGALTGGLGGAGAVAGIANAFGGFGGSSGLSQGQIQGRTAESLYQFPGR